LGNFETRLQASLRRDLPLYEYMDLRIESASGGVYRCRVPLSENNANHFHTVHAALQWASAEVLGGLVWTACKPKEGDFIPVVRRFEIDFKRPAWTELVAEAKFSDEEAGQLRDALKSKGRYDFELESVLRNSAGEIVATGTGFYAIRPMPAEAQR